MASRLVALRRRTSRIQRFFKALWQDTQALWREFQSSIVAFLLVTVGGGYIYGELHEFSGRGALAMIDRPYIMLQLMILETPYDAPEEWYLILFWYALPLIFIFIVGNGVADFVRLFFNRSERDAWKEALVSTYRRHIIVFGAGHVGLKVVRVLAEMGLDVVAIDNDPDEETLFVLNELDVPLIRGDGRATATLEKANLRQAAAFVACTGNDHANLEVIMKVRQLSPKVRIVTRVWDETLGAQMKQFMGVAGILSSSGISAPVFAGMALGVDITQVLIINDEEYSTAKLIVSEGSALLGRTVGDIQTNDKVDVVLHGRGNATTVQPPHDVVVNVGDTIVIFGLHLRTLAIASANYG